MAEDDRIGIVGLQRLQQVPHGSLLGFGPRVVITAVGGDTDLVADADGVLVVVAGMYPRQILMTRLVHLTVAGDIIVVAGEPETGVVAGDEVLDGEPAVAARGAAVNDD